MTYRGYVKNGVVVLEGPTGFPEGSQVEVSLVTPGENLPTLAERYKDIIGIAEGLPSDFAENHDHYIHGASKRTA